MGQCTLHTRMRLSECFSTPPLSKCNTSSHSAALAERIREDCGLSHFRFFGKKGDVGAHGKTNQLQWTNMQWPQLRKLMHGFDLSLVYTGDRKFLSAALLLTPQS